MGAEYFFLTDRSPTNVDLKHEAANIVNIPAGIELDWISIGSILMITITT